MLESDPDYLSKGHLAPVERISLKVRVTRVLVILTSTPGVAFLSFLDKE